MGDLNPPKEPGSPDEGGSGSDPKIFYAKVSNSIYGFTTATERDAFVKADEVDAAVYLEDGKILLMEVKNERRRSTARTLLEDATMGQKVALSSLWALVQILGRLLVTGYTALARLPTKAPRVHRPPGSGLLRVAEFVYSKRSYQEVLAPTIWDMQAEHFEALAAGRSIKARWITVRGRWSFLAAASAHGFVSLGKTLHRVWKLVT